MSTWLAILIAVAVYILLTQWLLPELERVGAIRIADGVVRPTMIA